MSQKIPTNIQLEWTPNPSSLKYVVNRRLIPSGAVNFTSLEAARGKSPLAEKLLGIEGVVGVMIGNTFVTVTKGEAGEWDALNDAVTQTLEDHLSSNRPAVIAEAAAPRPAGGESPVERQIWEILDAEIRPAVMNDGGDILLDRFENGTVYLHMRGSCSGCPSSLMTLKVGIEQRLREIIPEVNEVVSV
jgi:Fe-S cluster biogenesis protein NfuA